MEHLQNQHWTFTITLFGRPQCPGCGTPLSNDALEVCGGWVWCSQCAFLGLHGEQMWRDLLNSQFTARISTIRHGIRFMQAHQPEHAHKSLIELYEKFARQK